MVSSFVVIAACWLRIPCTRGIRRLKRVRPAELPPRTNGLGHAFSLSGVGRTRTWLQTSHNASSEIAVHRSGRIGPQHLCRATVRAPIP